MYKYIEVLSTYLVLRKYHLYLHIMTAVDFVLDIDEPTIEPVIHCYLCKFLRSLFRALFGVQEVSACVVPVVPFRDERSENSRAVAMSHVDPPSRRNCH